MDVSMQVEITGKKKKLNLYIIPYTKIHTICTKNVSVKK